MQAHLTEAGGELTQAITIKFNDNWSQVFYPRMETVDSDGNINWNSQKGGLSQGTYEFYIFFNRLHGILQLILIATNKQNNMLWKNDGDYWK